MKIKLIVTHEELNSAYTANQKYVNGFLGANIAQGALKLYENAEPLRVKGKYVTTTYTPLEDGGAEVEYEIKNTTYIKFLLFQQRYAEDIKEFITLLVPFLKRFASIAGIKLWKAFKEEVL